MSYETSGLLIGVDTFGDYLLCGYGSGLGRLERRIWLRRVIRRLARHLNIIGNLYGWHEMISFQIGALLKQLGGSNRPICRVPLV